MDIWVDQIPLEKYGKAREYSVRMTKDGRVSDMSVKINDKIPEWTVICQLTTTTVAYYATIKLFW